MIIYFDAEIDTDLARGTFKLTPGPSDQSLSFLSTPHFLAQQDVPESFYIFSAPVRELTFLQGILVPFHAEWYLETKVCVCDLKETTLWNITFTKSLCTVHMSVCAHMCVFNVTSFKQKSIYFTCNNHKF